jgi:ferredoxin-NADP reductase
VSTQARPEWADGHVVEAVDVAARTRRITVERPATRRAQPGTHVDVELPLAPGRSVTRSYSVVESNEDGSRLTISVLHTRDSRGGSEHMHRLAVGDTLRVTQPLQNFPLRVGARRYLLLAGGIGITALVETARVLHSLRADYTLVYVARSLDRLAYREQLEALHGDRLVVHVDEDGSPLDIDALVGSVAADGGHDTELYMCGPIRLMDAVRRAWSDHGLGAWNLRFETFGSSGWYDAEEFVVRVPDRGVETVVGRDSTLLEALVEAGLDVMYDCRKGECGLCLASVEAVDGALDHRDVFLSDAQKQAGRRICTCVSRAVSADRGAPVDAPVLTLRL